MRTQKTTLKRENYFKAGLSIFLLMIILINYSFSATYTSMAHYTWEIDVITPVSGPVGISNSPTSYISPDGNNGTYGLNPGSYGDNVELQLPNMVFQEGIYISIDFKRKEESADFLSKNNNFMFGMEAGELYAYYEIKNENGPTIKISLFSGYKIPKDNNFRTYEFDYNPDAGRATLKVDGILVAEKTTEKFHGLNWGKGKDMVVGKRANGDTTNVAIFDNLMINMAAMAAPLPVELVYFDGLNNNNNVLLGWATATEINNSHFEIERSSNGEDFELIGTIEGHGNSSIYNEYSFVDGQQANEAISYYRLKQVDFDGDFEYSKIISFNNDNLQNMSMSVYPNPVLSNSQVTVTGFAVFGVKQIMLVDMNGAQINLNTQTNNNQINLPNVSAGNYVLVIQENSKVNTMPLCIR